MYEDYDPNDIEVRVAELMVATADDADAGLSTSLQPVLQLLRGKLQMDMVFVSEFVDGNRVIRAASEVPGKQVVTVGDSDELEATWCQRVVDGRLPGFIEDGAKVQATGQAPATPFPIGTFMSVPVVLSSGKVYGTLCCFSHHVNGEVNPQDLRNLSFTAELTAKRVEKV